jgi:hypothetical protein
MKMRHLNPKIKDFTEAKEIVGMRCEIFCHRRQRRDFIYPKTCATLAGTLFNVDSIFDTASFS